MFRIVCLSLLLFLLGCATTFYTRVFRLESITPKKYYYALPKEMIDGKFAEFAGWDWLIRVVCLYETNNRQRLSRTEYSVMLQQTAYIPPVAKSLVDSISVTFLPTGLNSVLHLQKISSDSMSFKDEYRRMLRFGAIDIPFGIDTIMLEFTARDETGTTEDFQFRMIRYEGSHEKLGGFPKD